MCITARFKRARSPRHLKSYARPFRSCLFTVALTLTPSLTSIISSGPVALQRSASAEVVDRIIALVGDDVITLSELLEMTIPIEMKIKSTTDPSIHERLIREQREAALEQLIGKRLLVQLADEQGLTVTDAEVKAHVQQLISRQGWTPEQFKQYLESQRISREVIEKQSRDFLLQQKVTQMQLSRKLAVTELELKDKYREFISAAKGRKRVKGSHLLLTVPPGSTPAQEAAIKQRARELRARAERGEDFSALVKEFGQGPSASSGGDLGLISRGGGIPTVLEDAFLELDANGLSAPVRSAFGYHILWAREVISAPVQSFEEAEGQLRMKLREEKYQSALAEWLDELKSAVFIERRL